jgi:hypothetical protein
MGRCMAVVVHRERTERRPLWLSGLERRNECGVMYGQLWLEVGSVDDDTRCSGVKLSRSQVAGAV